MHIWLGECHVHAGINGADLKARVAEDPDAELFIHPECGCATSALYLVGAGVVPEERTKILSTSGMVDRGRATTAPKVLVATETGHAAPARPRPTRSSSSSRSTGGGVQVHEDDHAGQAAALAAATGTRRGRRAAPTSPSGPGASVERMIAIGTPSPTGE